MADQAESNQRTPPITSPPSPSPTIPEDNSNEAIMWAASDDDDSSTPHTDLLSLWLSNYTALPEFEAKEEPLTDVPGLVNFDLESPFLDLVDWNTTSATIMQAPVVTQPLWMQLHDPAAGKVDDLSQLALGIQSPSASILPLALNIQDHPEAFVSPLSLGIQPAPASSKTVAPQASLSPLSLGLQPPQAPISPVALGAEAPLTHGIQFPEASISPLISPLALGIQSPQTYIGIESDPASFLSLLPIPCTLPMAPPLCNLPSIPCTLPMAPPLWNLPLLPCTLPMAPPLWNFLPGPSPVPERRSWSMFLSTPPTQQQLLPHSTSASVSSSSSYPNPQLHHFFPAANTGYQQQVPDAHVSVTSSTPNANANFSVGFVPASQPSWSQGMTPHGSWTSNEPWISGVQGMKLPVPRRPRFLLPPTVETMSAPAPPSLLGNFRSSMGNVPNARGDARVWDHQRVQTGESSRPQKKSKLVLDPSDNEASHCSHDDVEVVPIARERFALELALNRNGKARALPGTAIDPQSLFARCQREKMRQRSKILQRLVPYGDKADTSILLEQAHIYIQNLEQQIKLLKSSVDWKSATPFVYNNMDL